jgi:hypothetical protein
MMEISTTYSYSRQQKTFYTYALQRQSNVMVPSTQLHICETRYSPSTYFPLLQKRDNAIYNIFITVLSDIASRYNLNFPPRKVSPVQPAMQLRTYFQLQLQSCLFPTQR